jgi:Protein of unknown function (DUF1214)
VVGTVEPDVDMKTPPKSSVDTMPAGKFFAYAAEILKLQPPHITDQPILTQMQRIGIVPGESFGIDKVDPAIKAGLQTAPEDALALMAWKMATIARVLNGWSMNTDTMGVYGNYYLKRAIIAQQGLGANLPVDTIYPLNLADETGKPLDGANAYVLLFAKGATPPVGAFWSITLYDSQGFQVPNSLNRFAVSSWMPFKPNPDGSLGVYFQNASPRLRRGGELATGAYGAVQPHDAALCAEARCSDGEVESPAGDEGDPADALGFVTRQNRPSSCISRQLAGSAPDTGGSMKPTPRCSALTYRSGHVTERV